MGTVELKDNKQSVFDVSEPDYYKLYKGMEQFELHKKLLTKEEYIGFLKGNIIKYQMRLGKKGKFEDISKDLLKIRTYTDECNKILEGDLPF